MGGREPTRTNWYHSRSSSGGPESSSDAVERIKTLHIEQKRCIVILADVKLWSSWIDVD